MKTLTLTDEGVHEAISREFRGEVSVRTRRPGKLFQVNVPAFFGDGDAAAVFARPADGGLELTDLGTTEMRISYHTELTPPVRGALALMAAEHGVRVDDGELSVPARPGEVLAALLAMLQVQTRAEHIARTTVAAERAAAVFKSEAKKFLRDMFGDALRENYTFAEVDPSGTYPVDAYVEQGGQQLCFALVSGGTSAERAVGIRHFLRPLAKAHFIALPADLERLPSATRKRVIDAFDTIACSAWDPDVARTKLRRVS